MSLDDLRESLAKRLSQTPPLGYKVTLNFEEDGQLHLDGTDGPTKVLDAMDGEADTVMTTSLETMQKIVAGDTDPNMAVLMGKLKISGKMGVALKLASYLES